MNFAFMFDQSLRKIAERDYAELENLNPHVATKSTLTLSGSIIEALLFDALVASEKWTVEKACENTLKSMIAVAHASGIITEDRLTDAVRSSRNLIHPGREIRDNVVFDETDAEAAKVAVKIVMRQVRTWASSERQKRKIAAALAKLNPDQIEFLLLFSLPKPPDSAQYEHPFLKFSVYDSSRELIQNGLLKREEAEVLNESETIRLVPEAIGLIEKVVIKKNIQRDSMVLNYRNIAASGRGGSGAPPHSSSRL